MRNVLILIIFAAAAGGLIWWMQSTAEPPARSGRSDAGLAVKASPGTLPGLDAGAARPVDAAPPPDAAVDEDFVRERGSLGMPVALVEKAFDDTVLGNTWKRVPGPTPTWRTDQKMEVSLLVEEGRVVGGRVTLPKDAATASLQGASPLLTGRHCALEPPGYVQADTSLGNRRSGSFECAGDKVWYRGEIAYEGGIAHPLWFEYRTEAF